MSTHHLAHSIAEGGQGAARTNLRKQNIRRERTRANTLIAQGDWDADFRLEKRWRRKRACHDPTIIERWLQSQLGREWDAVYSELCIRYPKRQARNLWIYEWIKQNVALHPNTQRFWYRFIVDWDGHLCCESEFTRTREFPRKAPPVEKPESWPNTQNPSNTWERPTHPFAVIDNVHYWMQRFWSIKTHVVRQPNSRPRIRIESTRTWHILRPFTAQELHYMSSLGMSTFAHWNVKNRIADFLQWEANYAPDREIVPILVSATLPPQD